MAWYGASGVWTRRAAITVVNSGPAASVDVNITIPPDWDDFWSQIDSSGNELRVVSYDSRTLLTYDVDDGSGGAFDKTNRLGRIQIDAATVINTSSVVLVWLYYGSTSNQGDASQAVVIASPVSGYIELGRPRGRAYTYQPPTPNLTRPNTILPPKRTTESVYVWVDVTPALQRRQTPGNTAALHEEAFYASMGVLNAAGADQTAMYDITKCRFVYHQPSGRTWFRAYVTAGSAATNYVVAPTIRTALPGSTTADQTLVPTAGLPVRDTLYS
jgi:hypothetical protein